MTIQLKDYPSGGAFVPSTDQMVIVRASSGALVVKAADVVNVQDHGILQSNSAGTNDTAIATLIAAYPNGAAFYFPKGSGVNVVYNISQPMAFGSMPWFHIFGDGFTSSNQNGSCIAANFSGSMITSTGTSAACQIRNIKLSNVHAAGNCVEFHSNSSSIISGCCFTAGLQGIFCVDNIFSLKISGCAFKATGSTGVGIGIMLHSGGGCTIDTCDFNGWNEGMRLCGSSVQVIGCRIEFCNIGIKTGFDESGGSFILSGSSILGGSNEACETGLYLGGTSSTLIACPFATSASPPPTGTLDYGIRAVGNLNNVVFSNLSVNGTYTVACISIENVNGPVVFNGVSATITSGGGTPWKITNLATVYGSIQWINCNYTAVGLGTPKIVATANVTAQNAAGTIATYTTPAVDGDYEVSSQVIVTAAASISTTIAVTYTDVNSGSQTMVLPAYAQAGTPVSSATIVATGTYQTPTFHIRVKASTAITIKLTTGTFTTVTWQGSGVIKETS